MPRFIHASGFDTRARKNTSNVKLMDVFWVDKVTLNGGAVTLPGVRVIYEKRVSLALRGREWVTIAFRGDNSHSVYNYR